MALAELGERGEGVAIARRGRGGGDDCRVRKDATGAHVHPLCEVIARLPQGAHDPEGATAADAVHARGATPGVASRRRRGLVEHGEELLLGPVGLPRLDEVGGKDVVQVDEDLDVERGVAQPVIGKRPPGPVGGAVALGQVES